MSLNSSQFHNHLTYAQVNKDLPMSFGEVFALISSAAWINMLLLVILVDSRSSEPQDMFSFS